MSCTDDDNNSNNNRASVPVDDLEHENKDGLKYKRKMLNGQHKIQFPLLSLQAL